VAADCAVDQAGEAARLNERFGALIDSGRAEILRTFSRGCVEQYAFITESGAFREHATVTASDVISDVARSVRAGQVRVGGARRADARTITRAGRDECLSLADGLGVAVLLLNTMLAALAEYLAEDQELMPCFSVAVAALNESITRHMHAVAGASAASALDRVHRAQVEERLRLARDLHDRVGEALAVGIRRLDLQEISCPAGRPELLSAPEAAAATWPDEDTPDVSREALVEAMRRLRVVTSDLREPPVANLEKALMRHLDSVQADADVRLHISGDEAWAPPAVLDEVFLILREALRNALTHAAPQLVLIGVEICARELTAWVMDDGCGFSPPAATASGSGLASMRERAALVGGRLVVSSMPGHGTRVELHLPLPDPDGGPDDLGNR
jgi:signal transduction histidine kinase